MASDLAPEPESAEESSDRSETHPETSLPDPAATEAWSSLTEDVIALRGREEFEGGTLEGSTLTILVPNSTAANHLKENFGEDLVRLWRERAGAGAVLQLATICYHLRCAVCLPFPLS
jgi:hypothetical protein